MKRAGRRRAKLLNDWPRAILLLIWIGSTVFYWIWVLVVYETDPQWFYIRQLAGPALSIAKASGAALNLNCMLILLPVCRNLISLMRGSSECCDKGSNRKNVRRVLDKNITFHKYFAYMIVLLSIIHIAAHYYSFDSLLDAWEADETQDQKKNQALSSLGEAEGQTWVNPIRQPGGQEETGLYLIGEALQTAAGITGYVLTVVFVLMLTSATEFIRRSYFEVFWFSHHLFIIFFLCLVTHGVQGLIRFQNNLDKHDPTYCYDEVDLEIWPDDPVCSVDPQFTSPGPASWKFVLAPVILYFIERCIRFWRSQQKVVITKVVKHPSKVIELQMKKRGFKMEAGQYIFIQCPSISQLEWHPFTLTSSPEEDFFSVHIRLVGDWTEALAKATQEAQEAHNLPRVAVDGPFGTSSTDLLKYEIGVCVAAGIGVTPFASILKSIWYQYQNAEKELILKKVYFFWICPDTNAFEWFSDLLQSLEEQMIEQGMGEFLSYNIYLTRGWNIQQARNIYLHEEENEDVVTGLKQKTFYGRPQWDQIFGKIAESHPGQHVGVFFCGPAGLSSTLHSMCDKHSTIKEDGVRFSYNKENF